MHHTQESLHSRYFTTSDGVRLHYRVSGNDEKEPLIMLPGWTGDTSVFHRNYPALDPHFRIYTLDYRCHGLSESVNYGLRTARFAMDLKELIDHLQLEKFNILGHSMGNAVIWCYITLFGQDKIKKLVIEDEAPCLVSDPAWTDEEDELYTGGSHKKDSYWDLVDALEISWEEAMMKFGGYFPMHKEIPPLPEYHYEEADPAPPPKPSQTLTCSCMPWHALSHSHMFLHILACPCMISCVFACSCMPSRGLAYPCT